MKYEFVLQRKENVVMEHNMHRREPFDIFDES